MTETVIGIDPGKKGAIAIDRGGSVEVCAIPYLGSEVDVLAIKNIISKKAHNLFRPDFPRFWDWHAWIENAQPRSGHKRKPVECPQCGAEVPVKGAEGVVSVATFVGNARLIEGVLRGMGIGVTRVWAQTWQRLALAGTGAKGRMAIKEASIAMAEKRFPDVNLYPKPRSRKKSSDRADALNILWFGSRCSQGTPK